MSIRRAGGALVVVAALLAAACSPAPPLDDDAADEPTPPAEVDEPDSELIVLADELERARDELLSVLEQLATTAEGGGSEGARRAVSLLTHSPDLRQQVGASEDPTGFLPADEPGEDVLSRLLAAVRAAGRGGTRVNTVLRDPVVGDTTTWQRQPEDRNGEIAEATTSGDGASISELEGQLPQALAWAMLAAGADGIDSAEAAERASAHTAVALTAVDQLADELRAEVTR